MTLLRVENLKLQYPKQSIYALNDISLALNAGETLAVVGGSGCGKSTLIRAILQLQTYQSGNIYWQNNNLKNLNPKQKKDFYRQVQVIFQDPLDALNPRLTIAQIIAEPLINLSSKKLSSQTIQQATKNVLKNVGLSPQILNRYPHEFSGGQCQRIGIARAMIIQPDLLICDEPVSALDVSVQAQIMNVLLDLKEKTQLSMIFISHDLSIVRHISDRIIVMDQGNIVETGTTLDIYNKPKHPYTQALLATIPTLK